MTYSIVARDRMTGQFGVATATGGPCVGALVPHISASGAICTQGDTNPYYAHDGMASLAGGEAAVETVENLTGFDPDNARRQLLAIARHGPPGAFTGAAMEAECGHLAEGEFAVAGNMLASPDVLPAMVKAFSHATGPLEVRLLEAMKAGESAGGDKRGTKSAALMVHAAEAFSEIDCRVDLSPHAIADLEKLVDVVRKGEYAAFLADRPRRAT